MITVYSTAWCAYCHAVTQYLDHKGVKYIEKDIEKDKSAANDAVGKSGQTGVPVIDVDGIIVVGFDRPSLDAALREKQLTQ